jgi:serine protease Do
VNANRTIALLSLALAWPAAAQQNLETAYRTTGQFVTAAFEPVRMVLQTSSALIAEGRTESGYGVIVSADGYLLVKASEIQPLKNPTVTVDKKVYQGARIVATDPEWDVALMKIDAEGLTPVNFAAGSQLPEGSWIVVNGVSSRFVRRALAGIISANPREISASGGAALGVVLKPDTKALEIEEVGETSGAKEAGLQKGDLILAVEDKPVKDIKELAESLKDRKAGSMVKITYRRGKEELSVQVRLAAKSEMFHLEMSRNDMMSGDVSKRRSGFPRVIQHDVMGNSKLMGGPVLDLDGKCVGMNIARANRAETFAIPVEELKTLTAALLKKAAETPAPESADTPK